MTLLFHGDDDLTDIRADIFSFGVTDFETQMLKSEEVVNRTLDARWYRNIADDYGLNWRNTPYDASLLLNGNTQLRDVSCYKSLQLIYLLLMKEAIEPDAFERQMSIFKKLYADEINEVLTAGVDYDWDQSGTIEAGENKQPQIRRLVRV